MAFAQVQAATQVATSGSSAVITVSATGTGNIVVVGIRIQTTFTCSSVTDSAGNTYALIGPYDSGTARLYLAYGVQVSGGATSVTVTFSGSTAYRCGADEFSGGAASNAAAFDASSNGTGTGTAVSVTSFSPAASGELIVAVASKAATAATWTAGAGYTLYGGGGSANLQSAYRLSGTTTETAPLTLSTSLAWAEIAIAIKPAAGGPSVNAGFFRFM